MVARPGVSWGLLISGLRAMRHGSKGGYDERRGERTAKIANRGPLFVVIVVYHQLGASTEGREGSCKQGSLDPSQQAPRSFRSSS